MNVVDECGDGDVGDVVTVDERFADVAGGENDGVALRRESSLTEVLHEEPALENGPFRPRGTDRVLGRMDLRLASAREQYDFFCAGVHGEAAKTAYLLGCTGDSEVGVIREVDRAGVGEGRAPGVFVVPVEGGLGRGGYRSHGEVHGSQALGDAAPRLALTAYEYREILACVLHRGSSFGVCLSSQIHNDVCSYAFKQSKFHSIVAFVHSEPVAAKLHWDDVRLFLALCRARTLGDAGRDLGVDQSTVSRRLAALEDTVAASLFERGRGGIVATKAAEALLPVAEEIEHAMARFAGAAESLERDVSGMVRIACPPDAAEVLIAPHLPALLARYPGLRIDLLADEQVVDLARRVADIALRTVRPETGDLLVRTMAPVDWVLAATPQLAKVLGTLRSWSEVPWVTFGDRFAHVPAARWVREHAETAPVVCSDSLRFQISVVCTGLGAALMPSKNVAHYGLVPLKLGPKLRRSMTPWPSDELFLVTHRSLRKVPRVSAVWDFLVEHAQ